jgi:hypothetical protein
MSKRNKLVGESIQMLMLTKSWSGLNMYEKLETQEKNHGGDAGYVADTEAFKLAEMLLQVMGFCKYSMYLVTKSPVMLIHHNQYD